ncbi:MAG TPA: hypothetical protein VMU51_21225 [Mycobacteriales bacterium]|nr:hypothetical protein [Mycobacteriales bacterium]
MLLTNVSPQRLFRLRFRTVEDGGFAGLVFYVGRAADDPEVHRRFVEDWSSIHDITDRYLGVIAPMPGKSILVAGPFEGGQGYAVPDVGLWGNHDRLRAESTRAVRMLPDPSVYGLDRHEFVVGAGSRIGSEADHQDSLTQVATVFQNFFGITESLLPCAVIVALREKEAFVIRLTGMLTGYRLLKYIKMRIEPVATRINQKETEIEAAKSALAAAHYRYLATHRAEAVYREWDEHRAEAADKLAEAAARRTGEAHELCSWMSERLTLRDPLTAEEDAQAQRLLVLMRTGRFGEPRRLRRVLTKLRSGYPTAHPHVAAVADFDALAFRAAADREQASQEALNRLKAEMSQICDDLRLDAAVTAAAADIGLEPTDSQESHQRRPFDWPITVLAPPSRSGPAVRLRRA